MSTLPIFPNPELPDWMQRARAPYQSGYYAMFSSLLGGIVTEPLLMQVPVDDHLVHRGDGVFVQHLHADLRERLQLVIAQLRDRSGI